MSLTGSILELLPSYIPKSDIKIEQEHEFEELSESTPKTVYEIEKGPVKRLDEVVAIVSGSARELEIGSEVEIRDTTGDGQYDSVALIDSDVLPDSGTSFQATYVAEPVISRYVGSFDDDLEELGDRIDESVFSKYIETASGKELDRIGAAFGDIGRRIGRNDDEYRSFLRSIVRTFDAIGTKSGIRFVAGAVLEIDPDLIEIEEDFEETAFTVRARHPNDSVSTSSLNDLIRTAAPTGVGVYEAPTLYTNTSVQIESDGSFVDPLGGSIGIGSGGSFIDPLGASIGIETIGFEQTSQELGLGSGSLGSDRTLSSNIKTLLSENVIGIETTGSFVTEETTGYGSGTLSSGRTFK